MALIETAIAVFQQISNGIGRLWILGVLPVFTLIYFLAGAVVIWLQDDVSSARVMRTLKRGSAVESLFYLINRLKKTFFHTTIVLITAAILLALNMLYDRTAAQILSGAGTVCSLVLGLTTMAVTVSAAIILLNKNYYLAFSIQEVLQTYHFQACIGCAIITCLLDCVAGILLLSFTTGTIADRLLLLLLECSTLYNLIACACCFYATYKIMFSGEKIELKLLTKLRKIFWISDFSTEAELKAADAWSFSAMRSNVEYLCAGYVTAARKLPIQNVESLHGMVPGGAEKALWERRSKRMQRLLFCVTAILYILSLLLCVVFLREHSLGLIILDTAAFIGTLVLTLFPKGPIQRTFPVLQSELMGYRMDTKQRSGILISRIGIRKRNRCKRFTDWMENLIAFFILALRQGVEQSEISSAVTLVLDWLSDIDERDRNAVLYLPVFTIGFFSLRAGKPLDALPPLFRKLEPTAEPDSPLGTMIREQVLYLTHSADAADSAAAINKYLSWLGAETNCHAS